MINGVSEYIVHFRERPQYENAFVINCNPNLDLKRVKLRKLLKFILYLLGNKINDSS